MIVIDHKGRVTDWNDAAEPLFLQTPDGQQLSEVAPDTLLAALAKVGVSTADYRDNSAVSDGAGTVDEEVNNIPLVVDGSERVFNIRLTTINQGSPRKQAKAILMRDITELEEKKRQLEDRTTELKRQNERLDDFAGILAHDLRSPLGVARGFTDHAQRTGSEDHFEKVHDAHDRMENMIDDLLTLARQGTEVVDTESVELDQVVRHAWTHVDTPEGELEIGTDRTLEADQSRVLNLFENLIRNSFDHAGEDSTVYVGDLESDAGFFVADDGPGIPDEARDEIFDYGYTTNSEGTGFGLSIVKDTAEAHGWEISLVDDSQYGAKFEFRL